MGIMKQKSGVGCGKNGSAELIRKESLSVRQPKHTYIVPNRDAYWQN